MCIRPSAITQRGEELLVASRSEFGTALGRKHGCLSECLPDDPNSAVARRIAGEVEENIPGVGRKIIPVGTEEIAKGLIKLKDGSEISILSIKNTLYHQYYQIEKLAPTAPELSSIIKEGTNYLKATPDEIVSLLPTKLRQHLINNKIKPRIGVNIGLKRDVVFLEEDGKTLIGQINIKVTERGPNNFQVYPDIGLGLKYRNILEMKGVGTEFLDRGLYEIKLRYKGKEGIAYLRGAGLSLNNLWIGKRGLIPVRKAFIRTHDNVVAVWMSKTEAETYQYVGTLTKWEGKDGIFGYVEAPGATNIQKLSISSIKTPPAGWKEIERWGFPPKPYLIEDGPTISWINLQ